MQRKRSTKPIIHSFVVHYGTIDWYILATRTQIQTFKILSRCPRSRLLNIQCQYKPIDICIYISRNKTNMKCAWNEWKAHQSTQHTLLHHSQEKTTIEGKRKNHNWSHTIIQSTLTSTLIHFYYWFFGHLKFVGFFPFPHSAEPNWAREFCVSFFNFVSWHGM